MKALRLYVLSLSVFTLLLLVVCETTSGGVDSFYLMFQFN